MKNQTIIDNYEVINTKENAYGVMYTFENKCGLFLTNDGFMSIYDKRGEEVMNAIYRDASIEQDLNEYGIYKK